MTAAPVTMKYLGIEPGRPPMATLRFDVTLRNDSVEPRWFILPVELDAPPSRPMAAGEGVDGVEVVALGGKGRVVVGRFQGRAGVQAILLPARADVTLHRFPVLVFEERTGEAKVDVVIARSITVGGEPASAWVGTAASDVSADVSDDTKQALSSRHTPDRHEVPITWDEERRVSVPVNL